VQKIFQRLEESPQFLFSILLFQHIGFLSPLLGVPKNGLSLELSSSVCPLSLALALHFRSDPGPFRYILERK